MATAWAWLLFAILSEVGGTVCMKLSEGFKKPVPSVLTMVLYLVSIAAMTMTTKRIPISMTYAIWSGLGTALITTIGVLYFREPMTAVKLISIGLIILGVIGLNLGGSGGNH